MTSSEPETLWVRHWASAQWRMALAPPAPTEGEDEGDD